MKQNRPLTITGGTLVTPDGLVEGTIRLEDGLIAAVGPGVTVDENDNVVNARRKLVTPGLVDLGVFSIDKPAFHFGGITRAALMPDQSPPLDYPSRVNFIAKSGKPDLGASFGSRDLRLARQAIGRAGAYARSGRAWYRDWTALDRGFRGYAALAAICGDA